MHTTHHIGGDQEGTRSRVIAEATHTGQGTLEALLGLIEEAVAVHLQLQVLTEAGAQALLSRAPHTPWKDASRGDVEPRDGVAQQPGSRSLQ